jgi:hypothetical protein
MRGVVCEATTARCNGLLLLALVRSGGDAPGRSRAAPGRAMAEVAHHPLVH